MEFEDNLGGVGPQAATVAGILLVAAASSAGAAAVYRVDPTRSRAGFDLGATMHTVHGATTKVSGRVRVDGSIGGPLAFTGTIEVDAASLDTGNKSRDRDLHGKSLEVSRYEAISLAPSRFTPDGPPDASGRVHGTLAGELTIRAVTKAVAIDTTLLPEDGGVRVEGRFDVAWADFGIPDPSVLFLRVKKTAHAHFDAVFVPVAPERP